MIKWRSTPDGVLFAPPRGQAPACPPGFEVITGQTHMFAPELKCSYRELQKVECGCCHSIYKYYCQRDNCFKLRITCEKCDDKDE